MISAQRLSTAPPSSHLLHLLHLCNSITLLNKVHAHLIVTGLIHNHILTAEIIDRYLLFNSSDLALSTHRTALRPTLLFQNLTIRSLSNHGFYHNLLSLYAELQHSGQHHSDHFTFPFVIKACAALSSIRPGKQAHCAVLRTGYGGNVGIETALLDMYAKNGGMWSAQKVFDGIPERDRVSWNALISGYSFNGFTKEAFEVFLKMRLAGVKPSGSTFVSLISVYSRLRAPMMGRSLHCLSIKCGVFGDMAMAPTLMSMYSSHEDVTSARLLFETIPRKDIVAWNAMVSAYAQNGKHDEAFEIFRLMHYANVRPNVITMVSIISCMCDISTSRYGKSIHAIGVKFGLSDQTSVVSALVSMYAKFGEIDVAHCLFLSAPKKELILWNSMISGYLLNGLWYVCLDTFRQMQLCGVMPDGISMIPAISACAISKDLRSGKSAHAYGLKRGFKSNTNLMNAFLAFYSDCDQLSTTMKLFHVMKSRNTISWNTLISVWAKNGDAEASVVSFNDMRREGVQFDVVTMISILPAFYWVEDPSRGMSFHALAIRSGYESDAPLTNALISMYSSDGNIDAGYRLIDGLPSRSVISWNALMTGCRSHNLYSEVMMFFDRMKKDGQKPDSVTLLNLLPVCESQLLGKSIHAYAVRNLVLWETSLLTSLMSMYARFGDVGSCSLLFEMVDKRSGVAWNAIASAYLQSKRVGEAVESFMEMLWMEVEPDPVTILNMVSACSLLGSVDMAECVTGLAVRRGLDKNNYVANSLIDMYARLGNMSMAEDLFDALEEKDSVTWSVMINAYGIHGDGKAAVGLFSEMRGLGIEPDGVAFVSILSACSHAGLVGEARVLFRLMMAEQKLLPRMEHYACMVDLLGRTGHLEEAYDLIRGLPFRPPPSMLESLVGACQYYGNTAVGEKVGKLLMEWDPQRPSSYVMLSKMYAAAEKWFDSGRLRFDMEGKGLRKDPGVSRIQ